MRKHTVLLLVFVQILALTALPWAQDLQPQLGQTLTLDNLYSSAVGLAPSSMVAAHPEDSSAIVPNVQTTYRPTTFTGFSGWVPYANPQLVFDGNTSTAATAAIVSHSTPVGAKELWSGWSRISGAPASVVLFIVWKGTCVGAGSASNAVVFTASNGVQGGTTDHPSTETTETFPLPTNIDLTSLQVTGGMVAAAGQFGQEACSQSVYEVYVVVTA